MKIYQIFKKVLSIQKFVKYKQKITRISCGVSEENQERRSFL
jgi:hypothetical protein